MLLLYTSITNNKILLYLEKVERKYSIIRYHVQIFCAQITCLAKMPLRLSLNVI